MLSMVTKDEDVKKRKPFETDAGEVAYNVGKRGLHGTVRRQLNHPLRSGGAATKK